MCEDNEFCDNEDACIRRDKIVGFDAKNKSSLINYFCSICNLILRYPSQLSCGHRFCKTCLNTEQPVIKCNKCNEETQTDRVILDRGCQHDMERLNIICSLCEWSGIFKDYPAHLENQHPAPYCSHCGETFNSVDSLTQHSLICEHTPMECDLKSYGCHEQYIRKDTKEHLLSEQHQYSVIKSLTLKLSYPMDNADEKHVASSRTTVTTNELSDRTMHGSLHESYEMMEHLLGGMQALNDDTQRLSSESHVYQDALQSFTEDISKVKLAVQETNSLMDAQKSNQQILEQSIASLQQQIEELRNTSYDGTLTWKISDIQQKIADAQSERQTSIYSPAFYSSPNGYKMRARLYLAGDGNARRTHMSIFFVLMRGDYDALLVFPFSFKVTFCLFDQSGNQRHLIDSFRPDIKSNSFQKPRSDMNIASGIPKFCPLTMIQQDSNPYVRDDTMLIKVVVDFGNLPKTVLPYTLGLNPGLPTPIQHDMIKSEILKRAQADVPSTSSTSG